MKVKILVQRAPRAIRDSAAALWWRRGFVTSLASSLLLLPLSAHAWGTDGHKIVAVIAADNLTPAAATHVATILGVPADKRSVAAAMEAAAILPDTEFRDQDRRTAPWHFIDLCLQDQRSDIPDRCPGGNCVTAKIDEYSKRLKDGNYDRWGATGDLAFLIHFVGDIHQPLHAATDDDRGANCVIVESGVRARNLHDAWDNAIVRRLEYSVDSGRPEATAHHLEQTYATEKQYDPWIPADDIAWESNQLARADVYAALRIPVEPCDPAADVCLNPAGHPVYLDSSYLDRSSVVAGHQLAKAGFRLASLLNETWAEPVSPIAATRPPDSAPSPVLSSTATGQIVGNRRSKIYAWPGCGSYDTMAPQNRVLFPNPAAAEQQGYRAARNCP